MEEDIVQRVSVLPKPLLHQWEERVEEGDVTRQSGWQRIQRVEE
jgi:hypothetical protein